MDLEGSVISPKYVIYIDKGGGLEDIAAAAGLGSSAVRSMHKGELIRGVVVRMCPVAIALLLSLSSSCGDSAFMRAKETVSDVSTRAGR